MQRFMLLHYGFEKPTGEIMQARRKWFADTAPVTVDAGGPFRSGREVSGDGTRELPPGADSITGYTIVEAEDLAAAERIARTNPFIASIRVYEIAGH